MSAQEIRINSRRYKIKKSQEYTIPSKGLIRSWKVIDCNFIPLLYINNKLVRYSRYDKFVISIPELRNYIRSIECPEEENERNLDLLEHLFFSNQLQSIEYYSTLGSKDFFDSIFTRDLKIQLLFKNGPEEVEIEEEYYDRKNNETIVETSEDKELQEEISNLKPIEYKRNLI